MIRLPPAVAKFFGVETVEDEVVEDAIARMKTRCALVDLSAYRRKPAQARLEIEAVEAIVHTFRDHYPDKNFTIRSGWPVVHVMMEGRSAHVEPWFGLDVDQGDGVEPFTVNCPTFNPPRDFGSVVRRMLNRIQDKKIEPEITLRQPAAQTPVRSTARVEPKRPEPARPEPSRRRATIDRK